MSESFTKIALVTGVSGFIGSTLCEHLQKAGFELKVVLRQNSMALLSGNQVIQIVKAELPNKDGLVSACKDVDVVFHLAGISHVGNVAEEEYQRINVEGTRVLAEAAKQAGVKKFVYISSVLAARAEDSETTTAYARSKKDAEDLLLELASDDFQCAIVRPANVYGPGMKGNIVGMIRRIKSGHLPPLPKLENQLQMIEVRDLCTALVLVAGSEDTNRKIYTLTDDQKYSPNILEDAIYEALGRKKPGWHTPRMVFFLASLAAQIANNLGLWRNDLGLRTYRNLIAHSDPGLTSSDVVSADLGFHPQRTFQSELPAILRVLEG